MGGRAGSGLPSQVLAVSGILDGGLAEILGQMSGHSLGIGGPSKVSGNRLRDFGDMSGVLLPSTSLSLGDKLSIQ